MLLAQTTKPGFEPTSPSNTSDRHLSAEFSLTHRTREVRNKMKRTQYIN